MQFSNYSSLDGVLYCKPHYDQLFMKTGSLDKSFEGTADILYSFIESTHHQLLVYASTWLDNQEKSRLIFPFCLIGFIGVNDKFSFEPFN
jgi:hypothetical protein